MSDSCCHVPQGEPGQDEPQKKDLHELIDLYRPLIIVALISVVAAVEMSMYGVMSFMNAAMGLFLLFLAALKFFDTKGFAEVFSKYDPLAMRFRGYAYLYPFIELALGAMYLSGSWPGFTNFAVIVIFSITTLGVLQVVRSGREVRCGCAGTKFNLPVGRVTLAENLVMGLMALANLLA